MAERAATIGATRGEVAERLVVERLRAVVRPDVLREDDKRLERMLYMGASRARHHLVVIAPAGVLGRLS